MRLLYVVPSVPCPVELGGNCPSYELLRSLAQRHEVDVAAFSESPADAQHLPRLRELCRRVELVQHATHWSRMGWRYPYLLLRSALSSRSLVVAKQDSPAMRHLVTRMVRENRYDVIHLDHLYMTQFVPSGFRGLTVLHEHNVESLILERFAATTGSPLHRLYARLDAAKLRAFEKEACTRADLVWTLGDDDRAHLERLTGGRARVRSVGVGLDLSYWSDAERRREPNRIAFVGVMRYRPNVDGVTWFCHEILPRVRRGVPDCRFVIIGKHPVPEVRALGACPNVEVVGGVDDIRPHLGACQAVVIPLRYGSGLKVKTVIALAMGSPVVATPIGVENLGVEDGAHAMVAADPAAFADKLVAVLSSEQLRRRLARTGRALVEQHYSRAALARRVELHYEELRAGRPPGPPR